MPKKPSKYRIKIWMMCDGATKYTMNVKVYLGKENNEVARGLASDVVCTLVQPFSGQDRGGRNVTTDNFFSSVDLANQLKNKKLTLVGTMKQNKREIPQEFKPARQRDENSSIFGFTKDLTFVSYVPKKNISVVLLSSLHHDSAIYRDSGKPEIIEYCKKNKRCSRHAESNVCKVHSTASNSQKDNGNVLWHDQHCCSKCTGHICTQHVQRSASGEDKKERILLRIW